MKKHLLALCLLALSHRLATAQKIDIPVGLESVTYSRAAPKALRAFVPRGGKSRFWGATNLQFAGKQIWVHVYDVRDTRSLKKPINENKRLDSGLDLFVFLQKGRLRLISSTRFSGSTYDTVGVGTLWLDPKSQKMPIIDVAFQNTGLYGTITQFATCVFNEGLSKKAVVELRFGEGADNSAGWNNWHTNFSVMKNGLIGIIYTQGRQSSRRTYYRWESNQFKAFRRIWLNEDEPEKSVEVPFDTPLETVDN